MRNLAHLGSTAMNFRIDKLIEMFALLNRLFFSPKLIVFHCEIFPLWSASDQALWDCECWSGHRRSEETPGTGRTLFIIIRGTEKAMSN